MDKFKDIRPYHDQEARAVLDGLLNNPECIAAASRVRFPRASSALPWLMNPLVAWVLKRKLASIQTLDDFQGIVVERFMTYMINNSTSGFSVTGTEQLDPGKAYVYVSNHRDIALDPGFISYALFHQGLGTVRIAIGDNLLTKDYVSDLMRLNKCFIVKRSAKGPRQLLVSLKKLSEYIRYSITEDHHSVWIAQREGRAKDGLDRSEPVIIKMFAMSGGKERSFAEAINELNIIPVSISYEFDPCDVAKSKELYQLADSGSYEKGEQEDVASIGAGIAGHKGHVHVSFGEVLRGDFKNADEVADLLDQRIIKNYVLHPSNFFAYEALYGHFPQGRYSSKSLPFDAKKLAEARRFFQARVESCPQAQRQYLLAAYANPIVAKEPASPS